MKNAQGGVDVVNNPDLHIPDRPEWFEWAAQVKRDIASGKIVMEQIGQPARAQQRAVG
jgi:hypothetical protein